MRILLIAARYFPHRGGLETLVYHLAREFAQTGHEVFIVTNRYPRTLPANEVVDDVPIRRLQFLYPRLAYLKTRRLDLWLAGYIYFPLTLIQFFMIMLRFRPDVVDLHYLGSPALFLWILHHVSRFRLVISFHGGDVDGEPYLTRFNRWLFQALSGRADRVTSCSQVLLEQASTLVPEISSKALVIHNGVDVELFMNSAPYRHTRPYLLGVGQLAYHKGFDVLVSAFAKIKQSFSGVDLLIAGHGQQRPALLTQIQTEGLSGRAHLLGAVSQEQVAALMQGCLCVVIPSRREPFGIVALEAMVTGKSIIAARVGGLVEVLAGAELLWISPDDSASLAEALMQALNGRVNSEATLEKNRLKASDYSWSKVCENYLDVLAVR